MLLLHAAVVINNNNDINNMGRWDGMDATLPVERLSLANTCPRLVNTSDDSNPYAFV